MIGLIAGLVKPLISGAVDYVSAVLVVGIIWLHDRWRLGCQRIKEHHAGTGGRRRKSSA